MSGRCDLLVVEVTVVSYHTHQGCEAPGHNGEQHRLISAASVPIVAPDLS